MTVTTAETLSVNGVVLNTLAKNIESLTGRLKVAALRTDNIIVPGRHGRLRTTQKFYDEGQIVLPMWVVGCDDNGNVPTTTRKQFMANVDTLTQLFRPGDGPIRLVHTLANGTARFIYTEVTDVIDFSIQGYNPIGKFSVSMRAPSPFWTETPPPYVTMPPTQNGAVNALLDMTAPVEDGIFTFTGPITNPRVEALYNGVPLFNPNWFQYSGTIPAGQQLRVDCGNWALTGLLGFTPNYSLFGHAGAARWLIIQPGPPGVAPGLKITGSNTTAATVVNLSAARKFLVG